MKLLARIAAIIALLLTILPALLSAIGICGEDIAKRTMLVGFILWFAAAPLALRRIEKADPQ